MGIKYSSGWLQGVLTSSVGNEHPLLTSYAFNPGSDEKTFGISATLTFPITLLHSDPDLAQIAIIDNHSIGSPGLITPVITVLATPTDGALPATYPCIPFPAGVSTSSILCPGLLLGDFYSGTVTLAFRAATKFVTTYEFSVMTLNTTEYDTIPSYILLPHRHQLRSQQPTWQRYVWSQPPQRR